ncbi:hypothetical protein J1N35_007668 [Gossypium stocksii]|uniref:HAT C-terminal dimerisation domain-containing protein n=1 Tax=Gossypium stocksii TaxID=47602 RepID=A0A9D3W8X0_9ROSI|nr:hypothetical protein J1N35_007668 [Gossypium stocksii]
MVFQEFARFLGALDIFDSFDSQQDRWLLDPKSWWLVHGASIPLLQNLALKLLRQPSSSSCCERNWSTYSFIHSIRKNKINPQRAEDLVFVYTNLRLLSRKTLHYKEGENKMWDIGGDVFDYLKELEFLELLAYLLMNRIWRWLLRCRKSCRLRWPNYLRPGIRRGNFTEHEEKMIIHLQALLANSEKQAPQTSQTFFLGLRQKEAS